MNSLLRKIKGIFLPQPDEGHEVEIGEEAFEIDLDDFEKLNCVGRGSFSSVCLCRLKKDRTVYSMKIIESTSDAESECRILFKIDHPCVMSAKYQFTCMTYKYIVMPFAIGGDLERYLRRRGGRFSEQQTQFYGAEMVLAVSYLHSLNIVHCDIKLANILMCSDGHIKVADFGLSLESMAYGLIEISQRGTPAYMAPEIWEGDGFGRPIDWWAVGVSLYEMLIGDQPFDDVRSICEGQVQFHRNIKPDAESLLKGFLTKNPATRLGGGSTYDDIRNHQIFASVKWDTQLTSPPPFVPDVESDIDLKYFD